MFIADEVMAGFGRTGKWFAIDHFDVTPDLITFAKGVTSGYVPLGGVAISPAIAETFAHRAYPGGLTYSGHPLASRGRRRDDQRDGGRGHRRERRADRRSRSSVPALRRHRAHGIRSVGEVRGLGVFWAVELVAEPGDQGTAGALRRQPARR